MSCAMQPYFAIEATIIIVCVRQAQYLDFFLGGEHIVNRSSSLTKDDDTIETAHVRRPMYASHNGNVV